MKTIRATKPIRPPKTIGRHVILGDLPALAQSPLDAAKTWAREYGDIVEVRFGPVRELVLNHPDYIQHVLQGNNRNYIKEQYLMRAVRKATGPAGDNLFTSDGDYWLRQRRLMQPAFHRRCIEQFAHTMVAETERELDRWEQNRATGQPIDIEQAMTRLTMEIICRTMFNVDIIGLTDELKNAFAVVNNYVMQASTSILIPPLYIPTARNRTFKQALNAIRSVILQVIRSHMQAADDAHSSGYLLDLMLAAHEESTGDRMSHDQLIAEMMGIVFAGHDTTSAALTWTLALLAQHPEVEARLRDEVDRVLGGQTPTLAHLRAMPYSLMVLQESLRLYPPAWGSTRQALSFDQIGDYIIEPGTKVLINIYGVHLSPRYWENPDQFMPERFGPEQPPITKFSYLPFSGGPRKCIGEQFALTEAQIILAMIMQRYKLHSVHTPPAVPEVRFILHTKAGLPMTITGR